MQKSIYKSALPTKNATNLQSEPINGREDMVQNNAGGYVFKTTIWDHLDRFLILGTVGGTYYVSAKDLTIDSVKNAVLPCLKKDGIKTINRIVEISHSGRAPKNDSAVFSLAVCAIYGTPDVVEFAYENLPKVARIGTHLFQFVDILNDAGKWNAAAKRGIAKWYTNRSQKSLLVQLLKYQQRNGWSHRDVLRLAHVKPTDDVQSSVFKYVTSGNMAQNSPDLIQAYEALKLNHDKKFVLNVLNEFSDITWEMLPSEVLRDPDIVMALLPNMGLTAMIRKLGQMSSIGLLKPFSDGEKLVISKLSDSEALKAARVHPISLLNSLKQYNEGRGLRGSLTWDVNQKVVDSLNDSFYEAFEYIPSIGKNFLIAVDCSGSMFGHMVNNFNLNAAEVSACMALAVAKREPSHLIVGFNDKLLELKITPKTRLNDALTLMGKFPWAGTDCAKPALYAKKNKLQVDSIAMFTDNETWSGAIHPTQALRDLRKTIGKPVTQIVCATSSTGFTIADPTDPRQLDIVGFDSACPQLIQTFCD